MNIFLVVPLLEEGADDQGHLGEEPILIMLTILITVIIVRNNTSSHSHSN